MCLCMVCIPLYNCINKLVFRFVVTMLDLLWVGVVWGGEGYDVQRRARGSQQIVAGAKDVRCGDL